MATITVCERQSGNLDKLNVILGVRGVVMVEEGLPRQTDKIGKWQRVTIDKFEREVSVGS